MYIRLAQGKINDPTKMDEATALVREGFVTLKQLPGFQSAYMGAIERMGAGLSSVSGTRKNTLVGFTRILLPGAARHAPRLSACKLSHLSSSR